MGWGCRWASEAGMPTSRPAVGGWVPRGAFVVAMKRAPKSSVFTLPLWSTRSYVACDDGSIKSADVRQQLLSGAWAEVRSPAPTANVPDLGGVPGKQTGCLLPMLLPPPCTRWVPRVPSCTPPLTQGGAKADGAPPLRLRTLTASPALELTAAHFALNRSGTYAAVAGSALEDPEISRVVVVDLTNCRPAPPAPTSPARASVPAGGRGGAAPASAHAVHAVHDVCEAVVLDAELFASRPGLRVLQIGWHPDSDSHLAVLTSGAPSWEWYCVVCCTIV